MFLDGFPIFFGSDEAVARSDGADTRFDLRGFAGLLNKGNKVLIGLEINLINTRDHADWITNRAGVEVMLDVFIANDELKEWGRLGIEGTAYADIEQTINGWIL